MYVTRMIKSVALVGPVFRDETLEVFDWKSKPLVMDVDYRISSNSSRAVLISLL